MREFEELLGLRRREVEKHLSLVIDLENAAKSRDSGRPVDTEHVNILKSALLVHFYNVIESVMSKITDEVSEDTRSHAPDLWIEGLFLAWVRHRAALENEMAPDDRLKKITDLIAEAAGRKTIGSTRIARREGNWTHKEIELVADSLGCQLAVVEEIKTRACVRHFLNEMPPMVYVRHMRNQLGHGNISFVDSAAALSVDQLRSLYETIMDYMAAVVASFVEYLDQKRYLRAPAA